MEMYLAMIEEYQNKAARNALLARRVRDSHQEEWFRRKAFNYYSHKATYYALQARQLVMELINK